MLSMLTCVKLLHELGKELVKELWLKSNTANCNELKISHLCMGITSMEQNLSVFPGTQAGTCQLVGTLNNDDLGQHIRGPAMAQAARAWFLGPQFLM